jgi:cleavage and polyadenylation specificity factor subunit 3
VTAQNHSHHHHLDHPHVHADPLGELEERQTRYARLLTFLSSHFGEATISIPEEEESIKPEKDTAMNGARSNAGSDKEQGELGEEPSIIVKVDEGEARVSLIDLVCPDFLKCDFTYPYT